MAWIVLAVVVLHVVGIHWGLPASDGWDNDGVAPRDFWPGLAATFTPGHYYTYPPVHLVILAVLTAPISCVALVRARSLALPDVIVEILKVPYMTSMAYVARLVALAMSVGIVVLVARIAEELRAHEIGTAVEARNLWRSGADDRAARAGWCAAVVSGINASLTYYAHTSNLDVPYLFWATWSLLLLVRAITRRQPRLLRQALALAVLAVATKDQAYAVFLLAVPMVLGLWILGDGWAREHRRRVVREVATAVGLAVGLFLVLDGVVFNPKGFIARIHFLTGSASKDYAEYTADWSGRLGILVDAARMFDRQYPSVFGIAFVFGLVDMLAFVRRVSGDRRVAHLAVAALPLLVAISFTVTFNWMSCRANPRFLLPQALLLAVYGGRALERCVFASRRALRVAGQAGASVAVAFGIFTCAAVDANLLYDPRYDMEVWLAAHVKPGDTIETYGLNVYMLRFPPGVRVIRVGPEPEVGRNPYPGIEEVEAPYAKAKERGARWIVVSTGWVWRYLIRPDPSLPSGRRLAPTQHRTASDEDATAWFEHLMRSEGAFALAHDSRYESRLPIVDVHGTTARAVWAYERKPGR